MTKNERSSDKAASIAGKVLAGAKPSTKDVKTLAGSVLTQAPNKPSGGKGKR